MFVFCQYWTVSNNMQFHAAISLFIAERLSARQLIVQCGLKSQLAYIYICMGATSITLRNAIESQVTFLIHVITTSVTEHFGPRGASMCLS